VLAREKLTEDDWEEVEETLLAADVGLAATTQIVGTVCGRSRWCSPPPRVPTCARLLVRELVAVLGPHLDRTLAPPGTTDCRATSSWWVSTARQDDDGRQDRPRARR
jgi:fused signal recognition particle receptor